MTDEKWELRRKMLKEWHKEAAKEYLEEKYQKANSTGNTRMLITLSQRIVLKDGSHLTYEDLTEFAKEKGFDYYPAATENQLNKADFF